MKHTAKNHNLPLLLLRPKSLGERGVSLIEILLGLLIVTIASIATLQYFAYAKGNISIQGNRRAAIERARERLEQLLAADIGAILPPDGAPRWASCTGSPCTWTLSAAPTTQTVSVDNFTEQPIETTVHWIDDPAAGTSTLDALELGVKVWFTPNTGADNDFNRVFVKTLRNAAL